jgi:hypothetical protein
MEIIREGWQHWVTLNANDLTWTALVIGVPASNAPMDFSAWFEGYLGAE